MTEPQYCQIEGHRIAYQATGDGPALLLVHGITTYSFIWQPIIPTLSTSFQVVSVDLLGCGNSDMPLDSSYSLKDHARRLSLFIDSLQLDRPHLIGHDLGGGIAQIVAVRSPEKISSMTLINSVGYDFWPVQPISIMRTPIVRDLLMGIADKRMLKRVVLRGLWHKDKLSEQLMEQFWKPLATSVGKKAFLLFAKCLNNQHLTEIEGLLRRLALPVLILRGDEDHFLSAAIAEKLHRDIPGSRLARIATASHYMMIDEPDWTARQVIEFLKEQDG